MNLRISHGQAIRSVLGCSRVTHFMMVSLGEDEACDGGAGDDVGLLHLEPPQHEQCDQVDGGGIRVDDGATCEHVGGAGDRSGGRGGGALDEALYALVVA